MRGNISARRKAATDNDRTAPRLFSPLPPRRGVPLKRATRSVLVWALVLVMFMPALSSLPTTMQQLSPAGSAHASTHQELAGEGPEYETRSLGGRNAFLDIGPDERFLGIDPVGKINATFNLVERNNVGATLFSYSYRILYLDGMVLQPYNGVTNVDVSVDPLGEANVTLLGSIPGSLRTDLMIRGIDKLKMDITFRGKDLHDNDLTIVRRAPLHLIQRVANLVDEGIYTLIKDNLTRYKDDVNLRTKAEFIDITGSWTTPEEVRTELTRLWTDKDITGAILWGYLPYAKWCMVHSDGSEEKVPIPVFYEDLDGSFIDVNSDGYYDKHIWGENDGCEIWVSHVMPPRTVVPSTNLDPRGLGTGGGLLGNYYNTRNMNNFKLTRVDPGIDFYWKVDLPEAVDDDDFSITWTGRIKADETEQYTLAPLHGGKIKIWIDGNLVHDKDGATWNTAEWLVDVYMTKGWHTIRIEYNNGNWGFNGATRLLWTSDNVLAGTINEWLDKSHAYHNGEMEYNERALLFMDYEYGTKSRMKNPILNKHLTPLYGDDIVVRGVVNGTNADDYIEALDMGHELISVWSHSGTNYHHISYPDRPSDVNSSASTWKIRGTEAGVVTLIWGCHSGDYGEKGEGTSMLSDNLAANYAFSTPNGLAGAGTTRSYGSTYRDVYWAWQNGSSMATGWFAYLDSGYDKELRMRQWVEGGEERWIEDVVLFGDPFITIDHRPRDLSMEIDGGAEVTSDDHVILSLSSKDAKEMRFKNAGGDWTPWESFATTKDWVIDEGYGAHRIFYQTRNDWGLARFPESEVIIMVSTMLDQLSLEIDEGALSTSSVMLSLSLDLGDADVTKVMMSLRDDGSEWSVWTPFVREPVWTLSKGDGDRSVRVRVFEEAGIFSTEAEDGILLDTRPPKSSATVDGTMGIGDWYISPVTVGLEASDALSELDRIEWNLDGGVWEKYDAPIVVDEDGPHVINFRSFDVLENAERTDKVSFMVDITGPEGLHIDLVDGNGFVNIPTINLKLNAIDLASGMDQMRFCINEGEWGDWIKFQRTHYIALPDLDGTYIIGFSSMDIAGNEAVSPETLVVVLDRTPPTIVLTDPVDERERVPVDQAIIIEMSETVDVSTFTGMNFLVQDEQGASVTGEFEFIEEEWTITFTPDEDMEHFTTYSVMMRGEITDLAGNQLNGGTGHMWTFTTVGVLPVGPTDVSTQQKDEIIEVSWDTVPHPYSGELEGYNIYRMTDDGAPGRAFEFRGSNSDTNFIDDDVEIGVPYHYQITALTTCGEGEASEVVSAILSPEDEPEPQPEPIDDPEDPEPVDIEPPVQVIEPDEVSIGSSAWMFVLIVIIGAMAAAVLFVMKGRKV